MLLVAAFWVLSPAPTVQAAETSLATSPTWIVGVMAHDQGPASDHHEHGIDLNLEFRTAPFDFWGSPRAHLGGTANFSGDTSILYAGIDFIPFEIPRWFLDVSISAAVHNGPLHKDPVKCQEQSDCGFGSRVLPLFGTEIGYRLNSKSAVTLYYDHMSHKWIIPGENEGIDRTGIRYLRAF